MPPPAWWVTRGATEGLSETGQNVTYATVAQVYRFAAAAAAELNAKLDAGAGQAINANTALWGNVTQPGLLGEYYTSGDFWLWNLRVSRHDATVDFAWGQATPDASLPARNFTARWTGQLLPPVGGNWLLEVEATAWAQLWINDVLVLKDNGWSGDLLTSRRAVVPLAGEVPTDLQLEYGPGNHPAVVRLKWAPTTGRPPDDHGAPLHGVYFANPDWSGDPLLERDETVAFGWWAGDTPPPEAPAETFSVMWTGEFVVPADGNYVLNTVNHAGAYVDGEWRSGGLEGNWFSAPFWLAAGVHSLEFALGELSNLDGIGWAIGPGEESPYGGGQPLPDTSGWFDLAGPGPNGAVLPPFNGGTDGAGRPVLRGEYFDGHGNPLISRDEAADFHWGNNAPDPAVPPDHFAARWYGFFDVPADGWYLPARQLGGHNDTLRLWVDGALLVDDGAWGPATGQPALAPPVWLDAGPHFVVIIYRHNADTSHYQPDSDGVIATVYDHATRPPWAAAIHWALIPDGEDTPTLPDWSAAPGSSGANGAAVTLPGSPAAASLVAGLRGEYFATASSSLPLLVHNEFPDFAWGLGSPGVTVSADRFFGRWTGSFLPTENGLTTFDVTATGGTLRLWVNDSLLVDATDLDSSNWRDVELTAGISAEIRLEFDLDRSLLADPAEHPAGLSLSRVLSDGELPPMVVPISGTQFASHDGGTGALGASPVVLRAEYFSGTSFAGSPVVQRDEAADLGAGTWPGGSARWTGKFALAAGGFFALAREAGGPLRIWIDGELRADDWAQPPTAPEVSAQLYLAAGAHDLVIEAAAGGDGRLHWALAPLHGSLPDWGSRPAEGYAATGPFVISQAFLQSQWGQEIRAVGVNGTVANNNLMETILRPIVALFRTRLTAIGWRDFPADTTGENAWTDATVAGLKRFFNFDLDSDTDGDGRTFAQEVKAGTDPYDYFNGQTPVLVSIEGDGQTGTEAGRLAYPWTVRVRTPDGIPLINAPVTFTLPENPDDGLLAATGDGSTPAAKTVEVRTDAAGYAWVYLKAPVAGRSSTPVARSGTGTHSVTRNITMTGAAPGSGGSWESTDLFGPATTRYATPEEREQNDLPPQPEARYAVIPLDLDSLILGPNNSGFDRRAVALDDDGGVLVTYRLAWPYSDWTPDDGGEPPISVARWVPATGVVTSYRGANNPIEEAAYGVAETESVAGAGFPWWGGELPELAPYAAGRYAASTPLPLQRRQAAVFSPGGVATYPMPDGWTSEAVGVNRDGLALIRQSGGSGTGSAAVQVWRGGFADGTGFTPLGELSRDAAGVFSGQTLAAGYVNRHGTIVGHHVTGTGVPEAGIYQTGPGGGWTPLPGAGAGLVLAGLTDGYTEGGRRALPTAYGWENIAPAGQPADLRAWVAWLAPDGTGWKRERLRVADPQSREPLRPGSGERRIFRMNNKRAAVFGDNRVLQENGTFADLGWFLPEDWGSPEALDIRDDGRILIRTSMTVSTPGSTVPTSTIVSGVSAVMVPIDKIDLRPHYDPGTATTFKPTQDDDFVVVSAGSDPDLASALVITLGTSNGTAPVQAHLKHKGDGALRFSLDTVMLTPGTPTVVQVWGTSASSAENKTSIALETTLPDGSTVTILEEDLTVIDGVDIEFAGNFYINVDTRDFKRRPWDGRPDPKPNSSVNFTNNYIYMNNYFLETYGRAPTQAERDAYERAVTQDVFGYASAISFKQGDNPAILTYKPWIDPLKVYVSKITAQHPQNVVLKDDKLIGAIIAMTNGWLEGPNQSENLVAPKIDLGDFVRLENTALTTSISALSMKQLQSVSLQDITDGIAAARGLGNSYNDFLDFMYNVRFYIPGLSKYRFKWENDSFGATKKTDFGKSIASKALLAKKQSSGLISVSWIFQDWNEFKFQGDLSNAKISTK